MLNQKLMGNPIERLYVDDVFSTYLYTGNGSTQAINNGIDLAGEGGLVWVKSRTTASNNRFVDTSRGPGSYLSSDTINAQATETTGVTSFSSAGFDLWSNVGYNGNGTNYASWTFRRAPKFFDVVTYTGNGASNRQIAHELGIAPGFITTKATSTTGDWNTYHRSATGDLKLNLTNAQAASRAIITAASESTFTVSGAANTNGVQYVAYIWAHDPSEDGFVQCGSYVGNGSASGPTVPLGWEPQFVLVKAAGGTSNWSIFDVMRGMAVGTGDQQLIADLVNAEASFGDGIDPAATGFQIKTSGTALNSSGVSYIYLAIRRPNKPPKTGAEVFNAITQSNTIDGANLNVTGTFPVDATFISLRQGGQGPYTASRLAGNAYLSTSSGATEGAGTPVFNADGLQNSIRWLGTGAADYVSYLLKRSPGFLDVVCDTGTGAAHAIAHSLTVAPELVIRKSRSAATQWEVWHSALAANEKLVLNSNAAKVTDAAAWNSTAPVASSFAVGTGANVNANGATFVTYLFATLAGISKVGSYTGNGGSQTIDCGFTTGARFILIKRTDSTGDWYVWDTARGIVAANDPHQSLNTTAAEVTTDDSVDPDVTGFVVSQNTATNINVNGASYIFLAIA